MVLPAAWSGWLSRGQPPAPTLAARSATSTLPTRPAFMALAPTNGALVTGPGTSMLPDEPRRPGAGRHARERHPDEHAESHVDRPVGGHRDQRRRRRHDRRHDRHDDRQPQPAPRRTRQHSRRRPSSRPRPTRRPRPPRPRVQRPTPQADHDRNADRLDSRRRLVPRPIQPAGATTAERAGDSAGWPSSTAASGSCSSSSSRSSASRSPARPIWARSGPDRSSAPRPRSR